ncbi:5-hydroxytryptamine receptor 3C-like isoform X2 [Takifugu rubripes]|uniref:5-hydroxytryptamine receptor 3C-like isoform X2 n=1 Tax=Takifugu rubripes TaxID=31033 RepID=UPI0005D1FCA5|nr:5-hydroxytryptamine receptor 3C-like isoform X2 [Takifugu rubripes]|eukprot:XP_011613226.1 PREDICTED: 5-hydroxytryptamine receptor 3C-like isoform X2 [Takifugu rubripes]
MPEVKAATITIICFSLLYECVVTLNCTNFTHDSFFNMLGERLKSQKIHRPVKMLSDSLNVSIDMTVVGILGVEWYIDGLSWDEKECGFTRVSLPRTIIWVPDIQIREFMEEDKSPKTPYVYLYSTGRVFDDKPMRVVSTCKLGIYAFPFDIQNCTLTFGSYLYSTDQLMLSASTTAAQILAESLHVSQTKTEWELVYIQVTPTNKEIGDMVYSYITYSLILKRRPVLYVVNLILPSIFLVLLDVFSFGLPPQTFDRSAFKMTLILGYTVFLLLMNDLLPVTGNDVPILNVFFSLSFAMMVASQLVTLFIVHVHFHSCYFSVAPQWLSVLMLQYVAPVICLSQRKQSNRITVSLPQRGEAVTASIVFPREFRNTSSKPVDPSLNPGSAEVKRLNRELAAISGHLLRQLKDSRSTQEWKKIANVMDRLMFYLYLLFCVMAFTTIGVVWHKSIVNSQRNIPQN